MRVCKVTFGAEPTEQEVLEFVNKNWNQLKYSRPIETEAKPRPRNPKRQLREARKQTQNAGTDIQASDYQCGVMFPIEEKL